MATVLEARAVITAVDQTRGAFDSLEARVKAASASTKSLGAAIASVGRVSGPMSEVTRSIARADAAIAAFGASTRAVDAVSASVAKAAQAMPKLSAEAAGLAKVVDETAAAGQRFAAEIGRIDAAAGRISAFRGLQTGFGDARRAFFEARKTVEDYDRALAASDAKLVALRQRHAIGEAARNRLWAAVPAGPNRADAADPARFAAKQAARDEALAPYTAALAEGKALRAEIEAEASANARLRREYGAAQGDAARTGQALDQQKSALAAVRREMEALVGGPIKSLTGAEAALKAQAEGVNRAMIEQARAAHVAAESAQAAVERRRARAERLHAVGELAGELLPFEGPEVLHVTREAALEGANLQHERIGLQNAGRTAEERDAIEARAREVSAALPTASMEENLKVVAETTSAFGTLDHALEHLKFMQQTMSVLKSAGGEHIHGSAGDVGRDFAKFFEERLTRPEDFEREAKQMIPAMVASGGTFNPREMYFFAQQAKSALPNYDMEFLSKIAPSLITAQGGERAGTAANAFNSIIMGKVNDKKQAEAWLKAGLLDASKTITKAGHAVGWSAGAVANTDLALSNPLRWAEEVALPALQKQGIDTDNRLELAKALGTMFRNQNGNMFANEIMQAASRARLHKDAGLYGRVGDADQIYDRNLHQDPTVALGALGEAIKSFAGTVTAPAMTTAAGDLASLAQGVASLGKVVGDWGRDHPKMAEAAGTTALAVGTGLGAALTIKLFSGLGALLSGGGGAAALVGSATALDGSAEALTGAALAIKEASAVRSVGAKGAAAGGAVSAAEGAAAPTLLRSAILAPEAVEAIAGGLGLGLATGLVGLVKASAAAQQPGQGGQWAAPTIATEALDRQRLADQQAEADELRRRIADNDARAKLPGSADPVNAPLRDRLAQLAGEIRQLQAGLAALPRAAPDRPALAPGVTLSDGNALWRPAAAPPPSAPPPSLSPPAGPPASRDSSGPVPVTIVGTAPAGMPARPLPPGLHPDYTLGNGAGGFGSPGLGAGPGFAPFPGHRAPDYHADAAHAVGLDAAPHIDLSGLAAATDKLGEIKGVLTSLGATPTAITVDSRAIDALIAKLLQARGLLTGLGAGGTTGSSGPSRVVAGPGVGRSR